MPRKYTPPVEADEKWCHSCRTAKPRRAAFYRARSKRDGLASQCKACSRITQARSADIKQQLEAAAHRMSSRPRPALKIDLECTA